MATVNLQAKPVQAAAGAANQAFGSFMPKAPLGPNVPQPTGVEPPQKVSTPSGAKPDISPMAEPPAVITTAKAKKKTTKNQQTLNAMIEAQKQAAEAAKQAGISEDDEVDLMISVTEAVTNAIQHGNREDESKKVYIRIEIVPPEVTIWVKDEGQGFDTEALPDPRDSQNVMNVSGRGILMMREFMDRVEFCRWKRGMAVKMTKRFTPRQ